MPVCDGFAFHVNAPNPPYNGITRFNAEKESDRKYIGLSNL